MKKKYFVAQEDTNIYNVFSVEDFDADSYLWGHNGEDGYFIDDFDIVAWFNSFKDACEWVEEHS